MLKRTVWATLLGFGFLFLILQSQIWPLIVFGTALFLAHTEFWRLHHGSLSLWHLLYSAGGLAFWGASTATLVHDLKLAPALFVLVAVVMLFGLAALARYSAERESDPSLLGLWVKSLLVISLPFAFIAAIAVLKTGFIYLLLLIGASWAADTGAIFAGKLFGSIPLAPKVSPNKTIEGAVGGIAAAGFSFYLASLAFPQAADRLSALGFTPFAAAVALFLAGAAVGLVGICGDLYFSMLKRQANAKDYSRIIPGHGGVLDRFDSMLFAAPLVYLLAILW